MKTRDEPAIKRTSGCDTSLASFIFSHGCTDWCSTYVAALKILGEAAKDSWTPEDVSGAVRRAIAKLDTPAVGITI